MTDPSIYMTEIVRRLQNHWVFRETDPYRTFGRYATFATLFKGSAFPRETPDDIWDDENDPRQELLAFIELKE